MTGDIIEPIVGNIVINSAGAIFDKDPDNGWMRRWETPLPPRAYIVVMTGKSVAVWRQECQWQNEMRAAAMVAACVVSPQHHLSILTEWAWMLSRFFGDCLVMVDANSCPGALPWLKEKGCVLWMRTQRDEAKPIGQARPVRHVGWEMKEINRVEALTQFQRMFADELVAVPCTQTLLELESTYHSAGDVTNLAKECDWLNNAAMAVIGLPSATPFIAPHPVGFMPDYMMEGGGGRNFDLGNMGS